MAGILEGKKTIVTGARGLARGMIAGLHREGAQIAAISRGESARRLVAEGLAEFAFGADLGDRAARRRAFDDALAALGGRVDILVNCAGIVRRHLPEDYPIEDWDEVIEVNLTAAWELCQLAGRRMIEQGGGKIINIASMLCYFGGVQVPAYSASKAGVMQMTRALAVAWAKHNIQVNALAPGYMATEINTALQNDPERSGAILSRIPAGRWGTPEDLAGPCVFLASPAADYINGAFIPVDGGYLSC